MDRGRDRRRDGLEERVYNELFKARRALAKWREREALEEEER
jgi:hypothetical protein